MSAPLSYSHYSNGHPCYYVLGGEPLMVRPQSRVPAAPLRCAYCGAAAQFELQLLPGLARVATTKFKCT